MSIQKDNSANTPAPKVVEIKDAREVELTEGELEQVAGGVRVEFYSKKEALTPSIKDGTSNITDGTSNT